jgi:Peptidase family M23
VVFRTDNRTRRWAALAAIVWALAVPSSAAAWSWPVTGPVLRPFHVDGDPYAAGQHRGVEIAAAPGEDVLAPIAGVVAFSGTVPGAGRTITLRTEDGYSITLLHLGSLAVRAGTAVAERDVVAGAELGAGEWGVPSVYLGVRLTAEPHGYLDPLSLLPARSGRAADPAPGPGPAPVEPPAGAVQQAEPPARVVTVPTPGVRAAPVAPPAARAQRTRPGRRLTRTSSRGVRSSRSVTPARVPVARPRRAFSPPREPERGRSSRLPVKEPSARRASARPATRTRPTAPARASEHLAVERPAARGEDRSRIWLIGLALFGLALCAVGVAARRRRGACPARRTVDENVLRKMSEAPADLEEHLAEPQPAIDSRRRRVAVCERPAAHRPCRRVRSPLRRLRALSPAARQQRPHGQRDGRARDARDGRRRQRRSVAA